MKLYPYVGPMEIRTRVAGAPSGVRVERVRDLEDWLRGTGRLPNRPRLIAVTFVVDEEGFLRVADRGSEHVACAGGRPVLSAGELFLVVDAGLRVEEVSNQSTGYCPEPESWPTVAVALDGAGIAHPDQFTRAVVFRLCPSCHERNIVKDSWFVCHLCGADLPPHWNF
jgi:hypothetical protein